MGLQFLQNVGELITADHEILNVENEWRWGHKNALIVHGDFTSWILSYSMKTKETSEPMSCLRSLFLRHRSRKDFTQTIPKHLLKLVKIHCGIMAQGHLNAQKRTEWQREPSAVWNKEQLSHSCESGLPEEWWDCAMECCFTCATCTTRRPMAWQPSRSTWPVTWRTINSFQIVEYIPITAKDMSRVHQFGTKTLKGTLLGISTFGKRSVRRLDDSRCWRVARISSLRNISGKIGKARSIRERTLRISVCKPNSKTSLSTKTVLASRGKSWARRWCWNGRRWQKGKQNRRFVVHVWRIHLSTSWRTSFEVLPRSWNIPDPIEICRRDESNSDEHIQCVWTHYQEFMDRSEGYIILRSGLGVQDSRSCVTSWRIQVGEWKTYGNPKHNQTRQYVAWSMDTIIQDTRRK